MNVFLCVLSVGLYFVHFVHALSLLGRVIYLLCADVGRPLVRFLNFYERVSTILCSYNIPLLWLHPQAAQRVCDFWVLPTSFYLTLSTLLSLNFDQSPLAVV